MAITEVEKRRLFMMCRRGMLEIDLFLMPFFEQMSDKLTNEQWRDFELLLNEQDPDLYNWLMGFGEPECPILQRMVTTIRHTNLAGIDPSV